jgi:HSP20 family protein
MENDRGATGGRGEMATPSGGFPVNLYQSQGRIMLAAPLPGLEPSNFHISIDGRLVSLKVDLRGPQQENTTKYFQREWATGPYSKIVHLPVWVDATRANATYDNGVLVLILPVAQAATSGRISMVKVGTAKGQAIGHVGKDFRSSPGGHPHLAITAPLEGKDLAG